MPSTSTPPPETRTHPPAGPLTLGIFDPPGDDAWAFAERMADLRDRLADASPAERGRAAAAAMLGRIFQPVRDGDRLAGRVRYPVAGFSPEPGGLGWYARLDGLPEAVARRWRGRTTADAVRAALPPEVAAELPSDDWMGTPGVAFPLYRIAGLQLDYARLIRDGVPEPIRPLLAPVFASYGWAGLETGAPATFADACQLFWLVALASQTWNWGRLDVALGPILARDLDAGRLDEAEALAIVQDLWRRMADFDNHYNHRVTIGGRGRPDPAAADRFAMLALEATRTVPTNQPQLSLRFDAGQDTALYRRALDVLAEGRTFPILYRDENFVPAAAAAFDVPEAVAEQALPYGCGETMLAARSVSSPNGVVNLPLAQLEAMAEAGPGADAEAVWDAYDRRVTRAMDALAVFQRVQYEVFFGTFALPVAEALMERPWIRTAAVETYGNTNVADGFARLAHGPDAPAFGNDDDRADAWAERVHRHACARCREAGERAGLRQLVVVVNNWANVVLGRLTPATPDGRADGEPFANGNNPAPGRDRAGVTAFLNSLARIRPGPDAGTVQNMKFSRAMFQDRPRLEALLEGWWSAGGVQAMITVVGPEDLEAAMREPERWGHLFVRVGGFSARFVDLPRDVQLEVLARTLHG